MSFSDQEDSKNAGSPINLYLFRYGSDVAAYFAYTDHTESVTHDAIVYGPQPITHEGVVASGGLDNAEVTVNVPNSAALAGLFRQYPPGQVINLTIFQRHLSDPDLETLAVWVGRVLGPKRRGSEVSIICEPVSTSIERAGLRRNYQVTCPHVLYGTSCRVDKADFVVTPTATAVSSSSVSFAGGWNGAVVPGKYQNGMAEWDGPDGVVVRTILRIPGGNQLSLSGPTTDLTIGMTVRVYPGCNHGSDCDAIFGNILNYGGFKWIPTENPINRNTFN